jgi:hypothetical protein
MYRWMLPGFIWRGRARRRATLSRLRALPAYQGKQLLGPDLRPAWWLLLYNPR